MSPRAHSRVRHSLSHAWLRVDPHKRGNNVWADGQLCEGVRVEGQTLHVSRHLFD